MIATRLSACQSPPGATFAAAVAGRTEVGGLPAILPRVEGAAWITGESELVIDDDDPLRDGYVL